MVATKVEILADNLSNTANISMGKVSKVKGMGKNLVKDAMKEEMRTHMVSNKGVMGAGIRAMANQI